MRHDAKRDEALPFVFEGGNLFYARAPRAPLEVGPCFSTIVLKNCSSPTTRRAKPYGVHARARTLQSTRARAGKNAAFH
jgi:hypothetical protein